VDEWEFGNFVMTANVAVLTHIIAYTVLFKFPFSGKFIFPFPERKIERNRGILRMEFTSHSIQE